MTENGWVDWHCQHPMMPSACGVADQVSAPGVEGGDVRTPSAHVYDSAHVYATLTVGDWWTEGEQPDRRPCAERDDTAAGHVPRVHVSGHGARAAAAASVDDIVWEDPMDTAERVVTAWRVSD